MKDISLMKHYRMRFFYGPIILAIAIFLLLILASCGGDDGSDPGPVSNETLLEIIQEEAAYAGFSDLLSGYTELETLLDTENGNYTVFVPSASALEGLPALLGYATLAEIPSETLASVLKYHIVKGQAIGPDDFENGGSLPTELSDARLAVTIDGSVLKVNDLTVNTSGVGDAINGYIYSIDGLFIPADLQFQLPTILETLEVESSNDLSLFYNLLLDNRTLFDGESITVFAPTNEAMTAFMDANRISEVVDIPAEVAERLLRFHIVTGSFSSADLSNGQKLAVSLNDSEMLNVSTENGTTSVNDAVVTQADLESLNGYVHKVDKVLLPETEETYDGTYAGLLYFNSQHQNFWNAAKQSSYFVSFTSETPEYTLLIPEDTYVAIDLDEDGADDLIAQHLIDEIVSLQDVILGDGEITNVLGITQYVTLAGNIGYINGSSRIKDIINMGSGQVVFLEQPIENGIYAQNVFEYIESNATDNLNPEFTQFYAALQAASESGLDLIAILSQTEFDGSAAPFTLFVPTDQAFSNLYDVTGVDDLNEIISAVGIDFVDRMLRHHFASEVKIFSPELLSLSELGMADGSKVTINPDPFALTSANTLPISDLEDAKITDTNILTTNGVIHVIDQVLLP